jgi:hypothetical protein
MNSWVSWSGAILSLMSKARDGGVPKTGDFMKGRLLSSRAPRRRSDNCLALDPAELAMPSSVILLPVNIEHVSHRQVSGYSLIRQVVAVLVSGFLVYHWPSYQS